MALNKGLNKKDGDVVVLVDTIRLDARNYYDFASRSLLVYNKTINSFKLSCTKTKVGNIRISLLDSLHLQICQFAMLSCEKFINLANALFALIKQSTIAVYKILIEYANEKKKLNQRVTTLLFEKIQATFLTPEIQSIHSSFLVVLKFIFNLWYCNRSTIFK